MYDFFVDLFCGNKCSSQKKIKNKCGSLTDCNNYRPIAIATITSKLLESIIGLLLKCEEYFFTSDN